MNSKLLFANMSGGLGNQMFQYAAADALATKLGLDLWVVDDMHVVYGAPSAYRLHDVFGISAKVVRPGGMQSALGWRGLPQVRRMLAKPSLRWLASKDMVFEPHFHYWSKLGCREGIRYLHGYWQSARYFDGHEEAIKKAFSFSGDLSVADQAVADAMRRQPSVAIHVRRGDYTNSKNSRVYAQASQRYYTEAIRYLRSNVNDPRFFVFSDDPDWVRQHLLDGDSMVVVDHNSGAQGANDMRLMSLADHNIIANSTFSWWAAWLNEHSQKKVVAPKQWFLSPEMDSSDVCPRDWALV